MESSVPDNIRRLLTQYTFEMDPNTKNDDLNCVRCRKLMIDAYQTHCECNYCRGCLVDYLAEEGTHFCKGKQGCNEERLVIDRNVTRSVNLNRKIEKIKVICPNGPCTHITELTEMEEHLRACTKHATECPYHIMGCKTEKASRDTMTTHLHNDSLTHSNLLIESIKNMKNDLERQIEEQRNENECIKERLRETEKRINEQDDEIRCLKAENKNKENRISTLEANSKTKEAGMVATMAELGAKINRIVTLERELSEARNTSEIRVNEETAKREREMAVQRGYVNDVRNNVAAMREEREKNDEEKERRMNKWIQWNKLCPNIDADFVWRIERCSTNRGTRLYSDPFYKNNYKFCLSLCIRNNDDITLRCYMMRGYNDASVEWPMRRAVTLSIIDQYTLIAYKSITFTFDKFLDDMSAFDKPSKDKNRYGIGSSSFIKYSSIKEAPSIIVNDIIVVSCVLSDP